MTAASHGLRPFFPPLTDESQAESDGEPIPYLGDLVILVRDLSPTEAHLLCGCLQSAGIQADAGDAHIVQAHGLLAIAVGGAKVRVPSAQLDEARHVLAAFRRGDFELGDDFDVGAGGA
ncbi:hypothetical protein [Ramlibacter sp.]|uniref:hypothetical protein n=1 Tax=Ramlibacter sp. TaxID=1917967 RepID=UPI0035B2F21E